MIGIFDVLVAVIAARMAGDEFVLIVNTEPLGVGFERDACAGVFGGDGISNVTRNCLEVRTVETRALS
jgi:hypothetical protein